MNELPGWQRDDFNCLPGNIPEVNEISPVNITTGPQAPVNTYNKKQGAAQAKKGKKLGEVLDSDKKKKVADPFQNLLRDLSNAHKNQLDELRLENDGLKQRLDAVLTSTWSMSDQSWIGSPSRAKQGDLQLSVKTADNEDKNALHDVPVEDQMRAKQTLTSNSTKFMPRILWSAHDNQEKLEEAAQLRLDNKGKVDQNVLDGIDDQHGLQEDPSDDHRWTRCIMHPLHTRRLLWDTFGALMIFWDVVTVPLGAFDPEDNGFTVFMDMFTLCYWTIDICVSFFTGYISKGYLVMSPKRIAIRYLTGWFFIDCWIVGVDWFFSIVQLLDSDALPMSPSNAARVVRAFRCARAYRLLRLRKLQKTWFAVKDQVESELVFLLPVLCQLIISLLIMCHIFGSIWYLIGSIGSGLGGRNWIQEENIAHMSLGHRYLVSLCWALHNFALASSVIEPQNAAEGLYAATMTFLGVAVFLIYLSVITVSFIDFRGLQGETTKEFWLLRRYLRQRKVPQGLKFRIMHYAEMQGKQQIEMLPEAKVTLLSYISNQLLSELSFNIYYSACFQHPLLIRLDGKSQILQDLTSKSLSKHIYAEGDVVDAQGLPANYMQFVQFGQLVYSKRNAECAELILQAEDWICEATLWVPWTFQGSTRAITASELIYIEAAEFGKVIQQDLEVWSFFTYYATRFVANLNSTPHFMLTDIHTGSEGKAEVRKLIGSVQKEEFREESRTSTKEDGHLRKSSYSSTGRRSSFVGRKSVMGIELPDAPSSSKPTLRAAARVKSKDRAAEELPPARAKSNDRPHTR